MKIVIYILNFIPSSLLYIINFFRYLFRYGGKFMLISPKSFIFNTFIGKGSSIAGGVFLRNCVIGKYSYINATPNGFLGNSIQTNLTNVSIGNFCSIGPHLEIIFGTHKTNYITTSPLYSLLGIYEDDSKNIDNHTTMIGNDVLIGCGVTIVGKNIKIGNGAIVGAGSVVTKNVEPYSVVGGVPAKVIKYRFSSDQILKLEKMQWRNWDEAEIKQYSNFIMSDNIEGFLSSSL